ncbi:signal peptidase I [Domibacillus robiginosus]|uniref:signal peptidase I n=1 Tax=Domibacillus robiginosus TaxID=1071054 RepID=UPI00067AE67F|nr:signal peptidase I [Domibacillus robiginosus]
MGRKRKKSKLLEGIKTIAVAFAIAGVIRTFVFSPIIVDGQSMMPTLQNEDKMILNKLDYKFKEPERFDIIVFHATEDEDYIKRIIGLPGDRIEYKDDTLYVNGKAYEEPYLDQYKQGLSSIPLTRSFKLEDTPVGSETVPEGYLFVMGDNRRNSKDSRLIGAVPIDQVVGDAKIIYWPIKDAGITE